MVIRISFIVAFSDDSQSFGRGSPDLHDFKIKLVEVI